jgi:adenylate cyclase
MLAGQLRHFFMSDPALLVRLRTRLESQDMRLTSAERDILRRLMNMYAGDDIHYLNYYGPPRTSVTAIPYHQALDPKRAPDFKDKLIFVGVSETLRENQNQDTFVTPFLSADGLKTHGVEIAATAVANLLEGNSLKRLNSVSVALVLLAWGVCVGFLWRTYSQGLASIMTVVAGASYVYLALHQFRVAEMWLPLVLPLSQTVLIITLAQWSNRKEDRVITKRIHRELEQWLPTHTVAQITSTKSAPRFNQQLVYSTCLHTDIQGYTELSHRLRPDELAAVMQNYREVISGPVLEHQGIVSDQHGDSMLAIWASSEPELVFRRKACFGALAIAEALQRFNSARDHPPLPTRIGLHADKIVLAKRAGDEPQRLRCSGRLLIPPAASKKKIKNSRLGYWCQARF